MPKSFSNPTFYNSGIPSFGTTFESVHSSEYLRNKKAKLLYNKNYKSYQTEGKLMNNDNYLLFERAKLIKNIEICENFPSFNTANLVSGLYTTENLGPDLTDLSAGVITGGVNVITDMSFSNLSCNVFYGTAIDLSGNTPFYYKYKIDPCGLLFGNTTCGYDNYQKFRVIKKPIINTASSLTGCKPIIASSNLFSNKEDNLNALLYNPVYNTTGNPTMTTVNGFTVLIFTYSGSIQFQGAGKDIGYIVIGGGGAGGGGADGQGWGSGGGGGGVKYISSTSQSLLANQTYTINVGSGGVGKYNSSGNSGNPSSIVGKSVNIVADGGGGGNVYNGIDDYGGIAGSGGGNGGSFTFVGPLFEAIDELNYTPSGYPNQSTSQQISLYGNYKLTYGSSGSSVYIPIINFNKILANGGGGGWANLPGQAGSISSGGGITLWGGGPSFASNFAVKFPNGYTASSSDYGCGGGGSGGGSRTDPQQGPYSGGNGSNGVVIMWFSS
jgi:hypothetical protein